MALPSNFYRNPAEILEQLERSTCKGCRYLGKAFGKDFCEHPARKSGKADRRCRHYSTKEED